MKRIKNRRTTFCLQSYKVYELGRERKKDRKQEFQEWREKEKERQRESKRERENG